MNLRPLWAKIKGDRYRHLIDESASPEQIVEDKNLSKLGDTLLNFLYSLSLSVSHGTPEGRKIPNRILAKAISGSRHSSMIPRRSDKHRKGDVVESIFAYAWLRGELNIRESIDFLHSITGDDFTTEEYAVALGQLLDKTLNEMGIPEDV